MVYGRALGGGARVVSRKSLCGGVSPRSTGGRSLWVVSVRGRSAYETVGDGGPNPKCLGPRVAWESFTPVRSSPVSELFGFGSGRVGPGSVTATVSAWVEVLVWRVTEMEGLRLESGSGSPPHRCLSVCGSVRGRWYVRGTTRGTSRPSPVGGTSRVFLSSRRWSTHGRFDARSGWDPVGTGAEEVPGPDPVLRPTSDLPPPDRVGLNDFSRLPLHFYPLFLFYRGRSGPTNTSFVPGRGRSSLPSRGPRRVSSLQGGGIVGGPEVGVRSWGPTFTEFLLRVLRPKFRAETTIDRCTITRSSTRG